MSNLHPTPEDNGPILALLRMTAGQQTLALPIREVREIQQVTRLTPMPRAPAFVRGVMNLRGAVVPVIDLGARLGQASAPLNRRSCVVVVSVPEYAGASEQMPSTTMGLLVDAVHDVFERTSQAIDPVPSLGADVDPRFLSGITHVADELVGLLALPQVLSQADLTDEMAAHQLHGLHSPTQPAPAGHPLAAAQAEPMGSPGAAH